MGELERTLRSTSQISSASVSSTELIPFSERATPHSASHSSSSSEPIHFRLGSPERFSTSSSQSFPHPSSSLALVEPNSSTSLYPDRRELVTYHMSTDDRQIQPISNTAQRFGDHPEYGDTHTSDSTYSHLFDNIEKLRNCLMEIAKDVQNLIAYYDALTTPEPMNIEAIANLRGRIKEKLESLLFNHCANSLTHVDCIKSLVLILSNKLDSTTAKQTQLINENIELRRHVLKLESEINILKEKMTPSSKEIALRKVLFILEYLETTIYKHFVKSSKSEPNTNCKFTIQELRDKLSISTKRSLARDCEKQLSQLITSIGYFQMENQLVKDIKRIVNRYRFQSILPLDCTAEMLQITMDNLLDNAGINQEEDRKTLKHIYLLICRLKGELETGKYPARI